MKKEIVGRHLEKQSLEKLRRSKEPELLAIYGRRRVGKTFLIRNYFEKEQTYFELTGQDKASLAQQLKNFAEAFGAVFLGGHTLATPTSWNHALTTLAREIDSTKRSGKVVLFFDELPWLASKRSDFLQALDYFWNSWGSKKQNLLVILCGSAGSWVIENILYNKGGLHNRVTETIRLLPFTLSETEKYLKSRKVNLDRKQCLEIYMATGGVPHYLRQVERGQSAAQNIDRICFTKDGLLAQEFDRLYSSLFESSEKYVRVVKALVRRRTGLSRDRLLALAGLTSGGSATRILEALEESGFISRAVPFGKKAQESVYRLVDEYSLFYMTWIRTAPRSVFGARPQGYWLTKRNTPSWMSWAGYAFEGICQKHIAQIKQGLGIAGVNTTDAAWMYRSMKRTAKGIQIDLLIDRADDCINLCEMKYSNSEFVIAKSYAATLRDKRNIFLERTGTRKSVFIVMITTYGTRENQYYDELISRQLTMDTLFES